jgi:DNA polymerase III alpha subunit
VPADGHPVLPPDVSESIRYFAAVGEDIRFGLGAVRNVGANVVDGIVEARGDEDSPASTTSSTRCRCTSRTSAPSSR